jgi:cyclohexa-1,5-dienecarbonyl-CoA hydratase
MTEVYKNITFTKTDNVAEITLSTPPLNIMTQAMMEEINRVLSQLAEDPDLHLLLFKAEGKFFSAGADVGEHTREKCPEMIPEFMRLFSLLNTIACPSVAVVQGSALGGGCELVTYCDMVIASDKAKFGQPEISVGVFPPVAVAIFPHLVGRNRSLELLLTGEVITAAEAERIGLINKVYPAGTFAEDAAEFIKKLTSKSSIVLKYTKKAIDTSLYAPVTQALESAASMYLDQLMATEDANEGLEAFLAKRPPDWKGK